MAPPPAIQRLLLAVAGLLMVAGGVSAVVWTGPSHPKAGISATIPPASSTAPPTTGSTPSSTTPATSASRSATSPPSAGATLPPGPTPAPSQGPAPTTGSHLANTGFSQVMTLLATFAVLAGVAIVWLEERTRLLRQLRLRPIVPPRSQRRGYQPRHSRRRR
jgi:hypothetical protein